MKAKTIYELKRNPYTTPPFEAGSGVQFIEMQGESHRSSKLTNAGVYAIRADYDKGMSGVDGAKKHGVSEGHFNRIGRRHIWRHLEEKELKK